MKLRMRKNSLRLRLTRSEITLLQESGFVEEAVEFPSGTLCYRIEGFSALPEVTADFSAGGITVRVPEQLAQRWMSSLQTGFVGQCGALEILVEKDFQCEHGPQDDDTFARMEVS